jgi:tryptophan 2,3-dioxygenase
MEPITSIKGKQRAKRDLELVERQKAELQRRREAALEAFDETERFLCEQAQAIADAIAEYDRKASQPKPEQQTLTAVK